MPLIAVLLVTFSCLLHAFRNLLLKQARDKASFTALYLTTAPLLYLPVFLYLARDARIPPAGWACIGGTALIYFGYFTGIAAAYQDGDLSVAYPLARGLGPALAFVAGVLLLSERPTTTGACGVLLILAAVVALQARRSQPQGTSIAAGRRSTLAAIFVGLTYAAYSIVDKIGVGRLHIQPFVYIYLTYTGAAIPVVPAIALRRGRDAILREWRENGRACVAVGALNLFTYSLVLLAMSLPGTPVGYIIPLRTLSVLFGVLFGVGVLREGRLLAKLAAAVLMMTGVALIAWKG